jgi:outer membrane protein TolC
MKPESMNKLIKFIIIFHIAVIFTSGALAQTSSLAVAPTYRTEIDIPPLGVIIDSVLKHNSMLSFRKQHVEVQDSKLKSERIYWTRNIGIQADTRYGTFDNFSTNADGLSTSSFATTSKQFNYAAGFYIKFPIFDFFNRKNQVKMAKLEVEEARSMAQFQEDEIRQTVISLYYELILKQKLLLIKSQSLGNGKVNMQMVEKEFRNGIVPIAEYVRITGMTSNLESDYELAKSDFLVSKKLLEDMAGFTFGLTDLN